MEEDINDLQFRRRPIHFEIAIFHKLYTRYFEIKLYMMFSNESLKRHEIMMVGSKPFKIIRNS